MHCSSPGPLTTVVVAGDHPLTLRAVVRALEGVPGVTVVATATNGPELVSQFEKHRPDVVLTDYWLPGYTGARATKRIRTLEPTARVVFFSGSDDAQTARACADAGGIGFVPKTSDGPQLVSEMRTGASERRTAVRPATPTELPNERLQNKLTAHEREVLSLLSEGHTNRDIGGRLYLSPETVKSHVRRIYRKLGVGDRASAVRVALTERLIDPR